MKTMTLVVMISGKQGSGKTQLAKNIAVHSMAEPRMLDLQVMKFADPLYDMEAKIAGILAHDYNTVIKTPNRRLLQVLGTEWGREQDPNFWVKIMQNRMNMLEMQARNLNIPRIYLIDDARFPNEIEAFQSNGPFKVLKIRLECQEHVRQVRRGEKWGGVTHPSETALDFYKGWDTIIFTDTHDEVETAELAWRKIMGEINAT